MKSLSALMILVSLTLLASANPLVNAADKGDLATVRSLLEAGEDINARDDEGETALHEAVDEGHLEMVQFLLSKGADPNLYDDEGETPFHESIEEGKLEVFQAFLADKGLNINAPDPNQRTPLMLCVMASRLDWVRLLLSRGAAVGMMDADGKTALQLTHEPDLQQLLKSRGAR